MLRNFRVYVAAIRFYKLCRKLDLPVGAKDQLERASRSIGNNVSEGYGRIAPKDKRRFYRIAFGSLRECQSVFEQEDVKDPVLLDLLDFLGGGLYKLVR